MAVFLGARAWRAAGGAEETPGGAGGEGDEGEDEESRVFVV